MTTQQKRIGQVQGRGQRIKQTEGHFNMTCVDTNGPPVVMERPEGMSDDEWHRISGIQGQVEHGDYKGLFDNVIDGGK